jgi:hypothetical protein
MLPRALLLRLWFLGVLVVAVARPSGAQLAAKSPFVAPSSVAIAAPSVGAPLEFRGFIETGAGMQFRIFDPAKKMGAWVKLNERNPDIEVLAKAYDSAGKTLTIEHQGRSLTLAEREAKVVSSGAAAQAVPPPSAPAVPMPSNVPAAVTQAVVLNPTPADEQRRLEAVASEVARRRAMGEQATQQISQGPPPPPSAPLNGARPR